MASIGIFYGSTTGSTKEVAEKLAKALGGADVHDVASAGASPADYDLVILGASTWGSGDLQDDMAEFLATVRGCSLGGKTAAVFGLGDQSGFGDTFVDGMADMAEALQAAGAELVGSWPADDYEYDASRALVDGSFLGLVIDEDNQPGKTDARLALWSEQLNQN
jgi:flavodoxin I